MIEWVADSLDNFKREDHWCEEHYNWLNDFLTDSDQRGIFFWNDFEDYTLRVSNS